MSSATPTQPIVLPVAIHEGLDASLEDAAEPRQIEPHALTGQGPQVGGDDGMGSIFGVEVAVEGRSEARHLVGLKAESSKGTARAGRVTEFGVRGPDDGGDLLEKQRLMRLALPEQRLRSCSLRKVDADTHDARDVGGSADDGGGPVDRVQRPVARSEVKHESGAERSLRALLEGFADEGLLVGQRGELPEGLRAVLERASGEALHGSVRADDATFLVGDRDEQPDRIECGVQLLRAQRHPRRRCLPHARLLTPDREPPRQGAPGLEREAKAAQRGRLPGR